MKKWIWIWMLGLSACNYSYEKSPMGSSSDRVSGQSMVADFQSVRNFVFGPKCLQCHSMATGNQGGLSLDTYEMTAAKLNSIYRRTVEIQDMPPRGDKLTADQMGLLKAWLDNGGPEKATASEPPLKGPWDWNSISTQVLSRSCLDCHSGENPEGRFNMTEYNEFKSKLPAVIDRLFVKQDMPLKPYPPMTMPQKNALLEWISRGLPQ